MKNEEFIPVIEAILFAAGFPVKYERIQDTLGLCYEELDELLSSKAFEYKGRGIRLVRFSDSCQLCTNEDYEKQVKATLGMRSGGALSNSALEVLAIVAYYQPVTRAYVDQVRGVDSSYTISVLVEKGLIEPCGKLDVPGRPTIYKTGEVFLRTMGISSVDELPALPDAASDEGIIELQNKINALRSGELEGQMSFDQ